jgi:hypothetical protein
MTKRQLKPRAFTDIKHCSIWEKMIRKGSTLAWVTTSDVTAETWRYILEYANEDFTFDAMEKIHDRVKDDKTKRNYKKQIRQIRVSLLQAREYFLAAEAATLFTSANHLYYCMMSLVTAIMLLRGDGEKSLDFLRKEPINQNHGLNFRTGISGSENAGVGLNILEKSYIEVHQNGHFRNWYSTLPKDGLVYAVTRRFQGTHSQIYRSHSGTERTLSLDQIISYKRSILDLLRYLPDLRDDMLRYGVRVPSSRINYEVHDRFPSSMIHMWTIHGATSRSDLEKILLGFKVHNDQWKLESDRGLDGIEGTVKISRTINIADHQSLIDAAEADSRAEGLHFEYPSIRETLSHDQIMYVDPLNTYEIVDAYLAGFALSMLSRYYPDLWISCLESHCKSAQLVERFVFTLMKKFPAMVLSFLAWPEDMVISMHRPPWFRL